MAPPIDGTIDDPPIDRTIDCTIDTTRPHIYTHLRFSQCSHSLTSYATEWRDTTARHSPTDLPARALVRSCDSVSSQLEVTHHMTSSHLDIYPSVSDTVVCHLNNEPTCLPQFQGLGALTSTLAFCLTSARCKYMHCPVTHITNTFASLTDIVSSMREFTSNTTLSRQLGMT